MFKSLRRRLTRRSQSVVIVQNFPANVDPMAAANLAGQRVLAQLRERGI